MRTPAIRGMEEMSLTHWPGRVATVVYLGGCTLRCSNCPSPHLVSWGKGRGVIPLDSVLDAIYRRRRWIEGVVVKGGEPLAHPELRELLELLKDFGLAVRLESNGTRPRNLERMIGLGLVDYVAVELRTAFGESYRRLARTPLHLEDLFRSVDVLLSGGVEYEFRTAVYDGIVTEGDVLSIARTIRGARRYVLRSVPGKGPGRGRLRALAQAASRYVRECLVEGSSPDRAPPGRVGTGEKERKGA